MVFCLFSTADSSISELKRRNKKKRLKTSKTSIPALPDNHSAQLICRDACVVRRGRLVGWYSMMQKRSTDAANGAFLYFLSQL
ncbi:hypothetical protein Y032_0119g872 [Ancylostoma ceylanicum]|uniref:Uncharacterized protein n=1 Tax=Ancylostoma ceylanicum TaxID=53326 RepID=A0A016TBD8_9BILA|nr:hypothetical protein Y032_0119g872 [Ancylostoma ceylanicum]